jgi:CheY-like chemotaxis protein
VPKIVYFFLSYFFTGKKTGKVQKIRGKILWADDEIDMLRPHILFLEERGYEVTPVTNAEDALSLTRQERFDIILLDEMMPGMDGLQALRLLKETSPSIPVVMITKSEEENLMNEAIGGQIEEYLTKPVNPSQVFSSCMRILEKQKISGEKLTRDYTAEFSEIATLMDGPIPAEGWMNIHLKLCERELDLDGHPDLGLRQTLQDQRRECNGAFGRFVEENYAAWVRSRPESRPVLLTDVIRRSVVPLLSGNRSVLFIVVDNLRLDQWLAIEPLLYPFFSVGRELVFSILPTATPYSRNSLFAGCFPVEIESLYPDFWQSGEDDESSRNRYEHQLLDAQLTRLGIKLKQDLRYVKIMDSEEAWNTAKHAQSMFNAPLTALVFNFVDLLAHKRSGSEILREIIPDESAYRSLTCTWFEHSALFQILRAAAESGVRVVLTSDHGSLRTMRGATVYADKETSTNVRYKVGRAIKGDPKQAISVKDPKKFGLPARGINANYLLAREDYYFVYPTNYHKYLALYRDSFQHGGVSLEEMVLPLVTLTER